MEALLAVIINSEQYDISRRKKIFFDESLDDEHASLNEEEYFENLQDGLVVYEACLNVHVCVWYHKLDAISSWRSQVRINGRVELSRNGLHGFLTEIHSVKNECRSLKSRPWPPGLTGSIQVNR